MLGVILEIVPSVSVCSSVQFAARQESSQVLSIELAVALAAQDKKMEASSLEFIVI